MALLEKQDVMPFQIYKACHHYDIVYFKTQEAISVLVWAWRCGKAVREKG